MTSTYPVIPFNLVVNPYRSLGSISAQASHLPHLTQGWQALVSKQDEQTIRILSFHINALSNE